MIKSKKLVGVVLFDKALMLLRERGPENLLPKQRKAAQKLLLLGEIYFSAFGQATVQNFAIIVFLQNKYC